MFEFKHENIIYEIQDEDERYIDTIFDYAWKIKWDSGWLPCCTPEETPKVRNSYIHDQLRKLERRGKWRKANPKQYFWRKILGKFLILFVAAAFGVLAVKLLPYALVFVFLLLEVLGFGKLLK